jgi:hypothetical protein
MNLLVILSWRFLRALSQALRRDFLQHLHCLASFVEATFCHEKSICLSGKHFDLGSMMQRVAIYQFYVFLIEMVMGYYLLIA